MIIYLAAVLEKDVEKNLAKLTKELGLPGYNRMMSFYYRKDVDNLIEQIKEENGEND